MSDRASVTGESGAHAEGAATRDAFLYGAVQVRQPATGYRAGHDAVLLAASLAARQGEHLAEAGSGAGAALLCAAHRLGDCRFTGFELDPAALALCQLGIADNGFGERVDAHIADVRERAAEWENRFDQSFCNPPYFEPGEIRPPPAGKQRAFMAEAPLKAWILFLYHVARPGGHVTLVHRAAVLAELLALLDTRLGEIEVLPIRPAPGMPARRILVRGRKGLKRGPVRLHDGLTLHETPGGPISGRAAAVLGGGALEWR